MLVLSRRRNETIVLPGLGITVRVVRLNGRTVRLGIEAPPDVKVVRGELVDGFSTRPHVVGPPLA
jgi:carbon storage regulator CsrA